MPPLYNTLTEVAEVIARRFNDGKGRAFGLVACQYRTSDGNKCAVGALVPNGHELSEAVANIYGTISRLIEQVPDFMKLFAKEVFNKCFLSKAQSLHDDKINWNEETGVFTGEGWVLFEDLCSEHGVTLQDRSHYVPTT